MFVDTGAFFAAADRSDRHHAEAVRAFDERGPAGDLETSDHVVVESWCLLSAKLGRTAALRFWDAMGTGVVRIHGVTAADFRVARSIARDWPDHDFSLIDCTSFAVMMSRGIHEVLAFDAHFAVFRFGPDRSRSFRLVR